MFPDASEGTWAAIREGSMFLAATVFPWIVSSMVIVFVARKAFFRKRRS